jgi:tripartite-type tricarboxylate transporter receptor subunit TctC
MNRRRFLYSAAISAITPKVLLAQESYPSKSIRLLVPFSAGGTPDLVARLLSVQLSNQLGQSFVIDNRLGANGIVAQDALVNSTPDGYSLLLNTGSQAINPSIYKKLPFDTFKDFAPVSLIAVAPALTLVINPNFAAKTFKDFLALAKKSDNVVSFGSPGTGNTLHLAGEMLNSMAGIKMLHVPYKGAAPALNAVIAGEVTACFLSTTAAVIAVNAGQVRPIAVTSSSRIKAFPDVPTISENGVPGFDLNGGWMGIFLLLPKLHKRLFINFRTKSTKPLRLPRLKQNYYLGKHLPSAALLKPLQHSFNLNMKSLQKLLKYPIFLCSSFITHINPYDF